MIYHLTTKVLYCTEIVVKDRNKLLNKRLIQTIVALCQYLSLTMMYRFNSNGQKNCKTLKHLTIENSYLIINICVCRRLTTSDVIHQNIQCHNFFRFRASTKFCNLSLYFFLIATLCFKAPSAPFCLILCISFALEIDL